MTHPLATLAFALAAYAALWALVRTVWLSRGRIARALRGAPDSDSRFRPKG